MSTNSALITENNESNFIRTDKKIIAIFQLVFFITLLNYILYSRLFVIGRYFNYDVKYVLQVLINNMIAHPVAIFLGTVLLIKAIQLIYGKKTGEIRFNKLRNVLFVISVIMIVLYAGSVLCFFIIHATNNFSLFLLPGFKVQETLKNSPEFTVANRIIFIIGNFKVILGFLAGIFFMAKSA